MRQEIHVESFRDFVGKSSNNDVDLILSKELLGSGIKSRRVVDTTLSEKQAKSVKEGMFIPQFLKEIELEDGRIYRQKVNFTVSDSDETSFVVVEWGEIENTEKTEE